MNQLADSIAANASAPRRLANEMGKRRGPGAEVIREPIDVEVEGGTLYVHPERGESVTQKGVVLPQGVQDPRPPRANPGEVIRPAAPEATEDEQPPENS